MRFSCVCDRLENTHGDGVSRNGGILAWCYLLLTALLPISSAQSLLSCTEPMPVANAYVTTQGPYPSGSVIRYLCVSPFSMSGSPARVCSNGTWDASPPTCSNVFLPAEFNTSTSSPLETSEGFPDWAVALIAFFIVIIILLLVCCLCVLLYLWRRTLSLGEAVEEGEKSEKPKLPPLSTCSSSSAPSRRSSTLSPRLGSISEDPIPVEPRVPRLSLGEASLGSTVSSPRMSRPDVTTPRFVIASVNGTPRIVRRN